MKMMTLDNIQQSGSRWQIGATYATIKKRQPITYFCHWGKTRIMWKNLVLNIGRLSWVVGKSENHTGRLGL